MTGIERDLELLKIEDVSSAAKSAGVHPSTSKNTEDMILKYKEQLKNLSPKSKEALDVFEKGVKKEANGSLRDAIEYYRKAMKLDEKVESLYRAKIYSEQTELGKRKHDKDHDDGKPARNRILDEKIIAKIDLKALLQSFSQEPIHVLDEEAPCPISKLPDDVVHLVIEQLIYLDTPSFVQFLLTCKKFAYLGLGTSHSWNVLSKIVYPKQNYDEQVAQLNGLTKNQDEMVKAYDHDWHKMLSERPFIKFNGIYISVVNYYREGGRAEGSSSWTNPIRMITYYRYLRFFSNGECIKLLTVEEPPNIVSKLTPEFETSGFSEKILRGTWTMTPDGQVRVESEGSVDRYRFVENLQISKSSNNRFKHSKLQWINYEFIDVRTTESNYFDIKKEKPYKFSRVKSYGQWN